MFGFISVLCLICLDFCQKSSKIVGNYGAIKNAETRMVLEIILSSVSRLLLLKKETGDAYTAKLRKYFYSVLDILCICISYLHILSVRNILNYMKINVLLNMFNYKQGSMTKSRCD